MRLGFDYILRRLNETLNTLKALHERRIFQYSSVAKVINQCCRDIDSHLLQFLVDSGVLNDEVGLLTLLLSRPLTTCN